MLEDKRGKKTRTYSQEVNYQEDLQQKSCLGGQTKGTMKNTRQGKKEIGEYAREDKLETEEPWRQSRRKKKKKLNKKNQD